MEPLLIIDLLNEMWKPANCVMITASGGGVVAAEMVLPEGGWRDARCVMDDG